MKIALFGGTFDPPHLGHLHIAEVAVESCQLDNVIFLPCHQSPHKAAQPVASGPQREEMLRLATAEFPWAEVSDWELQTAESSFSWQTAEHFVALFPKAKLYWLLGEDQWTSLDRWARPERLAELLTFIVFPRDGRIPMANPRYRAHFLTQQFPGRATDIRKQIQSEKVTAFLAPSVAQYIADHHLYGA